MKLSFVSAILAELPLEAVLDFAQSAGYDAVELMSWPVGRAERRYAGVTHVDVVDLPDAEATRIREEVERRGLTISGLGYYPNLLSPNPEEASVARTHLQRVMDAAPRLGVDVVNTFVGRDPSKSIDDNWPQFLAVWPPLVQRAEALGLRIGIENCPMFFSADEWPSGKNLAISPAVWRRMFAAIPSPAWGLNYDPSHLAWQMMDPVAPIAEFAHRFVHTHAKDVRLHRDRLNDVGILEVPLAYHSPVLPGRGEVDWPAFFAALHRAGYDGALAVEVEDRDYEGSLADRQRALIESAAFLRPLIEATR